MTGRENKLRKPQTKLSDADVADIYEKRLNGRTWRSLAREYGMTHPPIIFRVQAWCERTGATYV